MTRTTAARPRALLLTTGLLAAVGVTLAATAAAAPSIGQRTGAGALGQAAIPSITSENVKQIAGIPETAAISMEFARTGSFAYVSSSDTISVLDLSDPRDPKLRGTLVNLFFENESMTYGERMEDGKLTRFVIAAIDLFRVGSDDLQHVNVDEAQLAIIDVTDPDHPKTRSVTPTGDAPGAITSSTHTVQCLNQLDCTTAYTAGGRKGFFSVLDFTDLDNPVQVAEVNSPAAGANTIFKGGAGHYWDFDGVLGWHTGSGGSAAFDISDPRKPLLVNASNAQGIEPGLNDFIEHNSMRPNAEKFKPNTEPSVMNGNVLLVTEEDYFNDGDETACDKAGSFQTWYIDELDGPAYRAKNPDGTKVGVGSISNLDATNAPAEFGGGATTPAAAFCSAHWFDYHQDGFVAQGWYGAGLRILDVRDARNIKQVGYATGGATEVWDAYWVPQRDAAGVSIPGQKTNIVYTADAVRGIEVFEVTLPTEQTPGAQAPSDSPSPSMSSTASPAASASATASASASATPGASASATASASASATASASASATPGTGASTAPASAQTRSTSSGRLPTTGLGIALPLLAVGLMVGAGIAVRRHRT